MAHTVSKHCSKCNRDFRANVFARHFAVCKGLPPPKKIRGKDFDPNAGYKNGTRTAWNKGTGIPRITPVGPHGGYRVRAGRSKKFYVQDSFGTIVCLQSSHELQLSEILNKNSINWRREGCFKYDNKRYFPDFYLPEIGVYLDVKNEYLMKVDAEKIRKVKEQNPEIVLRVFTIDQAESMLGRPSGEVAS